MPPTLKKPRLAEPGPPESPTFLPGDHEATSPADDDLAEDQQLEMPATDERMTIPTVPTEVPPTLPTVTSSQAPTDVPPSEGAATTIVTGSAPTPTREPRAVLVPRKPIRRVRGVSPMPSPAHYSQAGPSTPTEFTAVPPTPSQITHGPLTPSHAIVPVPQGEPDFTPTEEILDQGPVAKRSGTPAREGSSPTYITEDRAELALPPTPTYEGSSPTYVDDDELPTPTLEPDTPAYGDDEDAAAVAYFGVGPAGTPRLPLPDEAAVTHMRMPGLESPTPTYDADDDTVFGDDVESVASFVGSAAPSAPGRKAAKPWHSAPPETPASIAPPTPLSAPFTPSMPTAGRPAAPSRPGKRRQQGGDDSDEELPPWKRRERRRKQ